MTPNLEIMTPGKVIWTWCSACMERTDHRYEPGGTKKLVCVDCEKEKAEKAAK